MQFEDYRKKAKWEKDNQIFDKIVKDIKSMIVNSGLDIIDQRSILYVCIEKMTEEYAENGIDFYSSARLLNHNLFMQGKSLT